MYKKINLHLGPTPIQATLVTDELCTCGKKYIHAPVGKQYVADLKSVRWVKWQCHGCGKESAIRIIDIWDERLIPEWFPLACLDIDAGIPFTPVPQNWEKVKDNKAAPAHRLPTERVA